METNNIRNSNHMNKTHKKELFFFFFFQGRLLKGRGSGETRLILFVGLLYVFDSMITKYSFVFLQFFAAEAVGGHLLWQYDYKQTEIDGFARQQAIAFGAVRHREQEIFTFIVLLSECVAVNLCVDFHIVEWPFQRKKMNRQRYCRLRLKYQLCRVRIVRKERKSERKRND